jgi:hypothetical protein
LATALLTCLLGVALLTRSCWQPSSTLQGRVALEFARALADGRYEHAHGLLAEDLARELTPSKLKESYEGMIAYGAGPARHVFLLYALGYRPGRRPHEIGWAYVVIAGDEFSEAVTIVVSLERGRAVVRQVEWGRP